MAEQTKDTTLECARCWKKKPRSEFPGKKVFWIGGWSDICTGCLWEITERKFGLSKIHSKVPDKGDSPVLWLYVTRRIVENAFIFDSVPTLKNGKPFPPSERSYKEQFLEMFFPRGKVKKHLELVDIRVASPLLRDKRLRAVNYSMICCRSELKENLPPELGIDRKTDDCCTILKRHAEVLRDDPERLSTEFISKLSKCDCRKSREEKK